MLSKHKQLIVMCVGIAVSGVGCSRRPARVHPPPIDATAAGAQAIQMFDANQDGRLAGAELEKCPGLKAAVATVDPTGQGITADAIAARIKSWQDSKLGRLQLSCLVLHNGGPLAGAEVKFVPEKFLGDEMKPATGKTDQNGTVIPSGVESGPNDPPGIAPGFYRVEITKPGLNIPSRYNTETILGQEVELRATGDLFDLRF